MVTLEVSSADRFPLFWKFRIDGRKLSVWWHLRWYCAVFKVMLIALWEVLIDDRHH